MECTTLIGEINLSLNNKVYMVWELRFLIYHRLVATHIYWIDIVCSWLSSICRGKLVFDPKILPMEHLKSSVHQNLSSKFVFRTFEDSVEKNVEISKEWIKKLYMSLYTTKLTFFYRRGLSWVKNGWFFIAWISLEAYYEKNCCTPWKISCSSTLVFLALSNLINH